MKRNRAFRMTRVLPLAALALGLGLGALSGPAWAGTATDNLGVSASVAANCTITTTPVAFGAYDPVTTNKTANLDAQGTIVVSCTEGSTVTVGLGPGGNFSGTRQMISGSDLLAYELYQESSRTTLWTTAITPVGITSPSPGIADQTAIVYGRIPGAQDAKVGPYTDTVVATVNF